MNSLQLFHFTFFNENVVDENTHARASTRRNGDLKLASRSAGSLEQFFFTVLIDEDKSYLALFLALRDLVIELLLREFRVFQRRRNDHGDFSRVRNIRVRQRFLTQDSARKRGRRGFFLQDEFDIVLFGPAARVIGRLAGELRNKERALGRISRGNNEIDELILARNISGGRIL